MKTILKSVINPIFPILLLGLGLRFYGINWDSGFHLHPDERMLIMVADKIRFWSNLNPDFFNYGSLPIYLLKGLNQTIDFILNTNTATYDGMLYTGRILSICADLLVVFLIYKISKILFHKTSVSFWSALLYSVAFFPIQNSHFFIVDTFVNLFLTFLIYLLLSYKNKPTLKKIFLIGIIFAAAITSKITSLVILPIIILTMILPHSNHKFHLSLKRRVIQNYIIQSMRKIGIFAITTIFFSFLFMPYAYIESHKFINDISAQIRMNSDPYIFPYTLQYIGTIPYLYYLKNIALWGLGPFISIFVVTGGVFGIERFVKILKFKIKSNKSNSLIISILSWKFGIFILFYLIYFAVIGKSAVKFMRYLLPIYPFFAILAGYGISKLTHFSKLNRLLFFASRVMSLLIILPILIWTFMFINIYSKPNTRIQATSWIDKFIRHGTTLAVEHWDDRIPIINIENYLIEELALYDIPDDQIKWNTISRQIQRSDYIIIASNRLYTPLQKLEKCLENPRCYPLTTNYYRKLFKGDLGFMKIAEFTSYPRLCFSENSCFILPDDMADESFTVYDHPKIMIFKKI